MDSLERFLLIASSDDVTQAIDFAALDRIAGGAQRTQVGCKCPSLKVRGFWTQVVALEIASPAARSARRRGAAHSCAPEQDVRRVLICWP